MNTENERMELLLSGGRNGTFMLKYQYELVYEFIFQKLVEREKVTLTELLEGAGKTLAEKFKGNFSWAMLQVKQDLEAKGLITVRMAKNRIQVIELKKIDWKKLNMVGGVL